MNHSISCIGESGPSRLSLPIRSVGTYSAKARTLQQEGTQFSLEIQQFAQIFESTQTHVSPISENMSSSQLATATFWNSANLNSRTRKPPFSIEANSSKWTSEINIIQELIFPFNYEKRNIISLTIKVRYFVRLIFFPFPAHTHYTLKQSLNCRLATI